jgi:hypothetical protein
MKHNGKVHFLNAGNTPDSVDEFVLSPYGVIVYDGDFFSVLIPWGRVLEVRIDK